MSLWRLREYFQRGAVYYKRTSVSPTVCNVLVVVLSPIYFLQDKTIQYLIHSQHITMADAGRKDFSDKLSEKVTPDSQKTYYDQAKEAVTDAYDKAASALTPEDNKSLGQRLGDSVQRGHDDVKGDAKSAANSGESAFDHLKQATADAVERVSAAVTGAKEGAENNAKK